MKIPKISKVLGLDKEWRKEKFAWFPVFSDSDKKWIWLEKYYKVKQIGFMGTIFTNHGIHYGVAEDEFMKMFPEHEVTKEIIRNKYARLNKKTIL